MNLKKEDLKPGETLWIILAVALLLRWLHLFIVGGTELVTVPIIDAAYYHRLAVIISGGDIIGDGIFFMSHLYPYLMGLFYAVLGAAPWKIMALQGLLSVATIWFLYRLTVRLANRKTALVASGIAAVYSPFLFYDAALLTASLILFLSILILNFTLDAFDKGDSSSLWKLGITLGLSALARPLALIFVPFVYLGLYRNERSTSLKKIALVVAGVAVILFPVGLRNLIVGGEFTLTTSSAGMNFYVGNNENATGLYWEAPFLSSVEPWAENEDYREVASEAVGRELSTREAGGYWLRKSLDWMLNEPGAYLSLFAKKAFYFWNRTEFANNVSYYIGKAESPLIRYNPFGFWLIGPLGLAGLIYLWRKRGWSTAQVPVLWGTAYFVGALLFFVASEYRLPVLLVLIPGAAYLFVEIWDRMKAKQMEAGLGLIALGLVFMPLTNFRTAFIVSGENPRMDYFNIGNTLIKQGRFEEAIPQFKKSLEVDPYFEEGLHRLAEAYYRAGEIDKAVEIGKRVGLKNPQDIIQIVKGDALREAYALLNEGKFKQAMDEFSYAGWDERKAAAETTRVSLLEEARKAYAEGKREKTLALFLQVHEADENIDPSVSYNIALLYWQFGKVDSAEVFATEAMEVDSLNMPSAYLLARIYNATDRREEAERLMRRVNPDAGTQRALLKEVRAEMDSLTVLEKWEDALNAYGKYGRPNFDIDPEDKLRIGRLQLEVGNIDLALKLLREAEEGGVFDPELYFQEGRALSMLGREREALSSFEKAISYDPNFVEAHLAIASYYLARNKIDRAWEELDAISHLEILDEELARHYESLADSLKARL